TTYLCNLRNLWFQFMQNKPKFQFLYTCIPVYLHTCILPNKPNLQKAVSPLAIDTTMEDGIVICRRRPEIFGQTLPVLPIYQDCFGCRSCSAFTRQTKKPNEANFGASKNGLNERNLIQ
ncbi:MAG TPA: hypothetical protein PKB02_08695, partial [Anaerohalosphaeraceae bacterium]|nr:hypothetical protein [Anaerohalosphaeraceae bacterium]